MSKLCALWRLSGVISVSIPFYVANEKLELNTVLLLGSQIDSDVLFFFFFVFFFFFHMVLSLVIS